MCFIDRHLKENEVLLQRASHHWFFFVAGCVVFFSGAAIAALPLSVAISAAGVALLARGLYLLFATEAAITNQRVILRTGLINLSIVSVENPDNISFRRGRVGKLLGYGTIFIRNPKGAIVSIPAMKNPESFFHGALEALSDVSDAA